MKNPIALTIFLLVFISLGAQEAESYYQPLKYRNIGPFRGGRSVGSSGVVGDPLTYYMGTTGGGLWKTEDAGQRWDNISDGFFKTGSVGAVAVSESNPNIVYVGMGEHAVRGVMTSYGDGVYKSTDAGKTWTHIGLKETQHISRVIIHPSNPSVVFVAAQGALYGSTEERGIYRSTDGGKTWEKVLYVNDMTGGVELSMDMNHPEVIYAAMWHHQRKPWTIISGGEGSGLYKSMDGGDTWKKIHTGLPKELGKMAISVCRSNSNRVYALVESDSNKGLGGLFISNNAGKSWSRVSDDNRLTQRAWYYTDIATDPNDDNTIYVMSASVLRSIDGGKSWENLGRGTHGDFHDLWINPKNSKNIVASNDGGAAISFNAGKTWSTQSNMSTAQIYRINADNLFPYNIYGGQQDNTSVKIASLSTGRYSIGREDWTYSAGGESAFLAFDPDDPRYVLGGVYLGYIEVLDTKSKSRTNIMAAPHQWLGRAARDMEYLFNWNAPIIHSIHEPGTFFHCANKVLKTTDMGRSWTEFSPDLTQNIDEKQGLGGIPYTNEAVGAENYGTIAYIIESPHEKGVYYTGSDDGFVFITRDNGKTWQNRTPKGLGESLVNAIDISPHDPATAYIATTKYKFNDYTPAIYKTADYGKTWTRINNGIPDGAYTRVVREDPDRKGLLYAGTELGVYISWNDGADWEPFQLNLPVTPIMDLKVHQGDLIVATSGRGFWVLDDLGLLAQPKVAGELKIYEPETAINSAWLSPLNANNPSFDGTNPFEGVNPANGVVIYYNLPKTDENAEVILEITNAGQERIHTFSSKRDKEQSVWPGGPAPAPTLSKKEGLNRFVWNMRCPTMPGVPNVWIEGSFGGHKVAPGTYTLTLKVGEAALTATAVIREDPNFETKPGQYEEHHMYMTAMEQTLTEMHHKVNQLYRAKNQLKELVNQLKKQDKTDLAGEGSKLIEALTKWDEDMVQRKSKAYDDVENFPNKFTAEYLFLINQGSNGGRSSVIPRVNESVKKRKKELDDQWRVLGEKADELIDVAIPSFNKKLWERGVGAIRMDN